MATVYRRAAARQDLFAHYVYLAENASEATAERFLTNVETSLNELAMQPEMGAPAATKRSELTGLRKWEVRGFDNILIFYLPRDDGVSIVRVLHAARDWWRMLGLVP